jgi:hypothetical protein
MRDFIEKQEERIAALEAENRELFGKVGELSDDLKSCDLEHVKALEAAGDRLQILLADEKSLTARLEAELAEARPKAKALDKIERLLNDNRLSLYEVKNDVDYTLRWPNGLLAAVQAVKE